MRHRARLMITCAVSFRLLRSGRFGIRSRTWVLVIRLRELLSRTMSVCKKKILVSNVFISTAILDRTLMVHTIEILFKSRPHAAPTYTRRVSAIKRLLFFYSLARRMQQNFSILHFRNLHLLNLGVFYTVRVFITVLLVKRLSDNFFVVVAMLYPFLR